MAEWSSNGGHYTPAQAAHILRLTPTRVRQLLQSGELEGERDGAGHWTIPARVVHERLECMRRDSFLEAVGYDPSSGPEMRERVEELRRQVDYLREQLESERRAHAAVRRLLAAALERIPSKLEPPLEPQGSSGSTGPNNAPLDDVGGTEPLLEHPEGEEVWLDAEGPRSETRAAESPSGSRESPVPSGAGPIPPSTSEEAYGATERPWAEEEEPERSWWRRFFGFD